MNKDFRVIVCHESLNFLGGAEKVALGFVQAARESGYPVDLITLIKTDWLRLESVFGRVTRPNREFSLFESNRPLDHFYGRFIFLPFMLHVGARNAISINTMGYRWLPAKCDVVYEHTPPFLWPNARSGSNILRKMYFPPYFLISRFMLKRLGSYIVTNSHYTAGKIMQLTSRSVDVVHPPVDLDEFTCDVEHRDDLVVSCGRYRQEKNYEFLITIAQHLKHIKFAIIGSYNKNQDEEYFTKLRRMVADRGLKNVTLMTNVPPNVRSTIYSRAKVYLHTMTDEDFGIAIVEAMAAGLVPVVHMSGGLWSDVVGQGKFGFGYSTTAGAVEAVERAIRVNSIFAKSMGEHVNSFERENFDRAVERILRRVAESKK